MSNPARQSLIDQVLTPADKTTLHELVMEFVNRPRRSQNVEDRRHWKPPPGYLYSADELDPSNGPDTQQPMTPTIDFPAGDSRWDTTPRYSKIDAKEYAKDLDELQAQSSDVWANTPQSEKPTFKDVARETLWEILTRLEEMGWK